MRFAAAHAAFLFALTAIGCGAQESPPWEIPQAPQSGLEAVDPGPVGQWGVDGPISSEVRAAMEWLNVHREAAGLPWLQHDPVLAQAASGHASVIILNPEPYAGGLSMHDEVEGLPGFVAEKYWDRVESVNCQEESLGEVISQQAAPVAAVVQWMESLYHRLPLLSASAGSAGYGRASGGVDHVSVMEVTRRSGDSSSVAIAWPCASQSSAASPVIAPVGTRGSKLAKSASDSTACSNDALADSSEKETMM